MCAAVYTEPELTILVLDFLKKEETLQCLQSVHRHVKVPFKIIYHHNGQADYPEQLLHIGLIDQLIQTKVNTGLGIGTRNLFAASFSPYSIYLQNDQFFMRDLTPEIFHELTLQISQYIPGRFDEDAPIAKSISLAGSPCGKGVYSERAHLIFTEDYKSWEDLGYHGAGPYHDGVWREAKIQKIYREENWVHYEWPEQLVADNGRRAIRENPDGSLWQHYPDTKRLWLLRGPVKERHVYPRFTDEEWARVIDSQIWPAGWIPEIERKESFHVWN